MFVTDPIPLGGRNRATVDLFVPRVESPCGSGVTLRCEVTEGGGYWVAVPRLAMDLDRPGAARCSSVVTGAQLRFVVASALEGSSSSPLAGFHLSVRFDPE